VYTFSTNRTFTPTSGELSAIYTKIDLGAPPASYDRLVGDRTGNPNRALSFKASENAVVLLEYSGGSWQETFKRGSEISGFGYDYDLSGNLILIGVPTFRDDTGKIEAWYYDDILSGFTAGTDYNGWNKVTKTNDEFYRGSDTGEFFGLSASLYNGYAYAHTLSGESTEFNLDYKGNLRVNRIVTSEKSKLIETNHNVKVLETQTNTKFKLFDQTTFAWIGCIYDSGTLDQDNATGNPDVNIRYKTDIMTRGADGPLEQATQVRYAGVGFKSENGNRMKYYNKHTGEYEELPESVAVYDTVENWPTFTETWFANLSANRAALSGIQFAHMCEIPIDQAIYDYDEGDMYLDEFSMQNFLDYKYDVSATFTDLSGINERVRIPTRYYKRLGSNYNTTWVSYKNSKIYANSETVPTVLSGSNTIIPMEQIQQLSGGIWDYEFLESIAGVLRFVLEAEHKSNIYSIDLINTNLNEALTDDNARNLIQKVVERAIREFAASAAPAHTQLWKITWIGQ
jgi:hypothetical protein